MKALVYDGFIFNDASKRWEMLTLSMRFFLNKNYFPKYGL